MSLLPRLYQKYNIFSNFITESIVQICNGYTCGETEVLFLVFLKYEMIPKCFTRFLALCQCINKYLNYIRTDEYVKIMKACLIKE